jgi:Animal haem peroxidase
MSTAPDSTTPTQPPPHGGVPRGLPLTPSSSTTSGRFGRMFRRLPVYEHDPKTLIALAGTMIQPLDEDGQLDEPLGQDTDGDENKGMLDGELRLPAGYTYFGQFVDHDITFDPASSLTRQNDPDALTNFRTPRFDLDSLYGAGPASHPYLYEQPEGEKLLLGESRSQDEEVAGPDLPRSPNGRALIGDPRNDENLITSQLQVAFIKFHNAVVDHVRKTNATLGPDERFKLAQQTVRWHYQWVVIHDFLRRLVGDDVVRDILRPEDYRSANARHTTIRPRLLFYHWKEQPFMPVEFSVAAYRFGHSMARPSYLINDVVKTPVVANASRIPLFAPDPGDDTKLTSLNGFRPLPASGGVQWKYLLVGIDGAPGPNDALLPQPSYTIDTELGHPLGCLPDNVARAQPLFAGILAAEAKSLAVRNLLRGRALGLPTGQDIARAMAIQPLDDELLERVELGPEARDDLKDRWPLWYYVLKEAEVEAGGEHLGPVGGRIVAEVLIGLLAGDPLSYLSVYPTWKPHLGPSPGRFTLSDLVNFALKDGS